MQQACTPLLDAHNPLGQEGEVGAGQAPGTELAAASAATSPWMPQVTCDTDPQRSGACGPLQEALHCCDRVAFFVATEARTQEHTHTGRHMHVHAHTDVHAHAHVHTHMHAGSIRARSTLCRCRAVQLSAQLARVTSPQFSGASRTPRTTGGCMTTLLGAEEAEAPC